MDSPVWFVGQFLSECILIHSEMICASFGLICALDTYLIYKLAVSALEN